MTNIYLVFNHYKALEIFDDVLHAMMLKYDKYWDNVPLIFGMAIVMDPMYKFELVDNCLEVIYANKMDKIREWRSDAGRKFTLLFINSCIL